MKTFGQWLLTEVRPMPNKRDWMTTKATTQYEPLRDSDTVRVYHGFRDFHLALRAIKFGLSGKEIVGRNYSYETNNNRSGLFCSAEMEVAKEFTSAYGVAVIIEFQCRARDLEAPVWPGGSYTVQGGMSQYWKGDSREEQDADREAGRLQARADVQKMRHVPDNIKQSDRPEMAFQLMSGRELQALFIGHLDPNGIRAVWVREPSEKGYQLTTSPFHRITRQEFLQKYGTTLAKWDYSEDDYTSRVFRPRDEFNADLFVDRLAKKFYGDYTPERMASMGMKSPEDEVIDGSRYLNDSQLLRYLWPKQHKGGVDWLHKIKQHNTGDEPAAALATAD